MHDRVLAPNHSRAGKLAVVLLMGDLARLGRTWWEGHRGDPGNGYRVHTGPAATDRDRPAKKEERADLELRAFRIQVEARKQRRKEARILIEQFFAQESMLWLVPRRQLRGPLGGWPGRKKREEGGREGD